MNKKNKIVKLRINFPIKHHDNQTEQHSHKYKSFDFVAHKASG